MISLDTQALILLYCFRLEALAANYHSESQVNFGLTYCVPVFHIQCTHKTNSNLHYIFCTMCRLEGAITYIPLYSSISY